MDKEKQNKLIILVGDSGCVKTELMKLVLQNHSEKFSAIKKSSTREARPGEENAIEIKSGCSIQEVDAMDYVYTGHNSNKYGFMKEQIEEPFNQGKSPMVIVDSEKLLKELCRNYKGRVCPIYIQRDESDEDFINELKRQGRKENQVLQRLESRNNAKELWYKERNIFGYRYIINGPFLSKEKFLGWFETIAEENNIDLIEAKHKKEVKGIVNYYRKLWTGRPALLSSDVGYEPIINEDEEKEDIR